MDHVLSLAALPDPTSLALALAAVALIGLSKGGFGGAFGIFGVPLMSLAIPPIQAAAILLPILLLMDAISLWKWWGRWDMPTLRAVLPGAVVGVGVGWLAAAVTSDSAVRLIVGLVALLFVARVALARLRRQPVKVATHRPIRAGFWGGVAGFTSFVAHAGGPPFQVYALPLGLEPQRYVSTSVVFFAVVNAIKVAPYAALGQFPMENLTASATLTPLIYAILVVVAVKLLYDGATGLLG